MAGLALGFSHVVVLSAMAMGATGSPGPQHVSTRFRISAGFVTNEAMPVQAPVERVPAMIFVPHVDRPAYLRAEPNTKYTRVAG